MTDRTTTNFGWSYPTENADAATWGTTLNNTIIAIDAQCFLFALKTGVLTSFNTRVGAITLTSGDVTGALGYTPPNVGGGNSFTGEQIITNGGPFTQADYLALRPTAFGVGHPQLVFTKGTLATIWSIALSDGATNTGTLQFLATHATFSGDILAVLANGTTATTQSAVDNSTNVATTAYVDNALAGNQIDHGTGYTLAASDQGRQLRCSTAGAVAWTIPDNGSVPFIGGTQFQILVGIGSVLTLSPITSSLNWAPSGATGARTITGPARATLTKFSTNTWFLDGVGIT